MNYGKEVENEGEKRMERQKRIKKWIKEKTKVGKQETSISLAKEERQTYL